MSSHVGQAWSSGALVPAELRDGKVLSLSAAYSIPTFDICLGSPGSESPSNVSAYTEVSRIGPMITQSQYHASQLTDYMYPSKHLYGKIGVIRDSRRWMKRASIAMLPRSSVAEALAIFPDASSFTLCNATADLAYSWTRKDVLCSV